jgi:hypothetical protein
MASQQDILKLLQANKSALIQLMHSADGQRLIAMLTKAQGGNALKEAAAAAASGNTAALTAMLSALTATPEGAALIGRLKGGAAPK